MHERIGIRAARPEPPAPGARGPEPSSRRPSAGRRAAATASRRPGGFLIPGLLVVGMLLVAGCSRRGPALAQVKGTVLYDGQPLAGATVSFVPDGSKGTKGRMAIGVTGADGRFSLRSFAPDDGAVTGFHNVSIAAMDSVPEDPAPQPNGQPGPTPPLKSRIPARYNDPATSGFSAEVKAGTANEFEFKLTKGK